MNTNQSYCTQEEAVLINLPSLPDGELFTTKDVRLKPSNFATFLCSVIRDIEKVDCCLLSGGGIRGNKDYIGKTVSITARFYITVMSVAYYL